MSAPQQPEATIAQEERRRYPRYDVRVRVELQAEDATEPLFLDTTDISRNGCCVAIAPPLFAGTRVSVGLSLRDKQVRVRGCIVTRHPQFGNGIMFLRFEGDGEEQLRKYLDTIRGD